MGVPSFLLNFQSQRVDTIIAPDGTVLYKRAVGQKTGTYDDPVGWQGVATHTSGDSYTAGTDGIVVTGGIDETDLVTPRPHLVDASGHPIIETRTRRVKISQTPAISNAAIYAAKDAIGPLLTFAGAARAGILSGIVEAVTIMDKGQQMAQMDLVLFSITFTAPTDNAVFDPTDAELATIVGVIPILTGDWKDFNDNSVAHVRPNMPYVLAGTSLFGALVSRGTPTYTSVADLIITLFVKTD